MIGQNGSQFTFQTPTNFAGQFTVTATAKDGFTSTPNTFTITMPNHAPKFPTTLGVIYLNQDTIFMHHDTTKTLDFSAAPTLVTDADNDSLTFGAQVTGYTGTAPASVLVSGSQVTIIPNQNFVGTFSVKFTASDGYVTTSKTVQVRVTNSAVTLAKIPNQTATAGGTLDLQLTPGNPDGDTLTAKASVQGYSLAYSLDKQYGFYLDSSGLHQNFHYQNEKWIKSTNGNWYAIKPDGSLWLLGNTNVRGGANAFAQQIAQLDSSYWSDPSQLYNAYYDESTQQFSAAPKPPDNVTATIVQDSNDPTKYDLSVDLTQNSSFTGTFQVTVTFSDGPSTVTRTFLVTVS
jgi:hypothetical protein